MTHWSPRRLPHHLIGTVSIYHVLHELVGHVLTCTVIEGIEHGKERADDKNISILIERHRDEA